MLPVRYVSVIAASSQAVAAAATELDLDPASGTYVAYADWNDFSKFDQLGVCSFVHNGTPAAAGDVDAGGAAGAAANFNSNPLPTMIGLVYESATRKQLRNDDGKAIWCVMVDDGGTQRVLFFTGGLSNATHAAIPTGGATVDIIMGARASTSDIVAPLTTLGYTLHELDFVAGEFEENEDETLSVQSITANTTLTTAQVQAKKRVEYLNTNNNIVLTLPASPADGSRVQIKVAGGLSGCSLAPNGAETIDGVAASLPMGSNFAGEAVAITGGWLIL